MWYKASFQMLFHWIKDEKYLPLLKMFLFTYLPICLFTFQAQQFPYILLQKALNCTLFSCIWIAFWPKTPYGGAYSTSPYSLVVGTTHLLFVDHFWKDNLNPDNIFYDIASLVKKEVHTVFCDTYLLNFLVNDGWAQVYIAAKYQNFKYNFCKVSHFRKVFHNTGLE